MKKNVVIFFSLFITVLFTGCGYQKEVLFSGKTMGTTYHVKVVAGYFEHLNGLKNKINLKLEKINESMSTYMDDSEISLFNRLRQTGEEFCISEDFFNVVSEAKKVYNLSDGAWDGTVKPLVDLWGFGNPSYQKHIPSPGEIQSCLDEKGFNSIEIKDNHCLTKKKASVELDLASIAKGYGVDQVAAVIKKEGYRNFLVEIGGEVIAAGTRKDGSKWKVGINRPGKDVPYDQVYKVVLLHDKAIATSGDYRNYFTIGQNLYSHILNPKTGYPVSNGVVSVSIISDTCVFADGLATAVMVMGHEKGLKLLNRLDDVEGLIVVRKKDGKLINYFSEGFKRYLDKVSSNRK